MSHLQCYEFDCKLSGLLDNTEPLLVASCLTAPRLVNLACGGCYGADKLGLIREHTHIHTWTHTEIDAGDDNLKAKTGLGWKQQFSFKKMYCKIMSVKWQPFCSGLSVLWEDRFVAKSFPEPIIATYHINSLASGRFEWYFWQIICKLNLLIGGWDILWYCPEVIVTGPYWW